MCEDDQREFLNGWYILVIISDVMAIIGSILKMEIQAKVIMRHKLLAWNAVDTRVFFFIAFTIEHYDNHFIYDVLIMSMIIY